MDTTTKTEEDIRYALNIVAQIDAKAEEALAPLMEAMRRLNYPPEFEILMWKTVARKANTYAARVK